MAELTKTHGTHGASASAPRHLEHAVSVVQVGALMDEAQKAEFRGNSKKAIDRYQEALYTVLHDKTDDSEQRELIATITTRITALGGHVPADVQRVGAPPPT